MASRQIPALWARRADAEVSLEIMVESTVEDAALDWLKSLGWRVAHGLDIAAGEPVAERAYYGWVVVENHPKDPVGSRRLSGRPALS